MLSTSIEKNKITLLERQQLTTLAAYRTALIKLFQVFVNQNLHVIKKCIDLKIVQCWKIPVSQIFLRSYLTWGGRGGVEHHKK